MIAVVEKDNGAKASNSKKASYDKRKAKQFPMLLPLPCRAKKGSALFEQWVNDHFIRLPEMEFSFPSYVRRQRGTIHSIEEKAMHWSSMLLSKELFNEKHKVRKILFKQEQYVLIISQA